MPPWRLLTPYFGLAEDKTIFYSITFFLLAKAALSCSGKLEKEAGIHEKFYKK